MVWGEDRMRFVILVAALCVVACGNRERSTGAAQTVHATLNIEANQPDIAVECTGIVQERDFYGDRPIASATRDARVGLVISPRSHSVSVEGDPTQFNTCDPGRCDLDVATDTIKWSGTSEFEKDGTSLHLTSAAELNRRTGDYSSKIVMKFASPDTKVSRDVSTGTFKCSRADAAN